MTIDNEQLLARLAALEAEVAELRAKVEKPKVTEETLRMISAVVAAHLGKTARVRQVKIADSGNPTEWRVQGRAAIQGSHRLQ